jgi:hypothetical protein
MHLFQTNILIYGVFYMSRTWGFMLKKMVVFTYMVQYVLHALTNSDAYKTYYTIHVWYVLHAAANSDACKTYYTIHVYKTIFLKMNPQIWNKEDIIN